MTEQEKINIIHQEEIIAKLNSMIEHDLEPGSEKYAALLCDRNTAVQTLSDYKKSVSMREKEEAETKKIEEPKKWYEKKWVDHAVNFGGKVIFGVVMIGYMIINEQGVPDKITQSAFGKMFTKDI